MISEIQDPAIHGAVAFLKDIIYRPMGYFLPSVTNDESPSLTSSVGSSICVRSKVATQKVRIFRSERIVLCPDLSVNSLMKTRRAAECMLLVKVIAALS
jgi:hypothetical protein